MSGRKKRIAGFDFPDDAASKLFDCHVSVAYCKPKELFKLSKVTKCGRTSDWACVNRHYGILNEMLDQAAGLIPKPSILTRQLDEWLRHDNRVWALKDVERAVGDLRCMLQSLMALKRDRKSAPKNYPHLQVLMDKMCLNADNGDVFEGDDQSELHGHGGMASDGENTDDGNSDSDDIDVDCFSTR